MALTDTACKNAKPKERAYKLSAGEGLHLLVTPAGKRLWRLRYRQPGKARVEADGTNRGRPESMTSLGSYPETSLAEARDKAREALKRLRNDQLTPVEAKRVEQAQHANTFKDVAQEWLSKRHFAPATLEKAKWTFDDLLYPFIGSKPVGQLTAPDILHVLRKIEARGKHETAHRTKQRVSQVIRYAIATGRAERDPTVDLRGALTPLKVESHAAITDPVKVGELLRAIDGYTGQPATEAALKLAPLVFVRPGELRAAEWEEFTLTGKHPEWRIPAERMKMREQHLVPLSTQAVAILRALEPYTGRGRYVFPSLRTRERPMSENAITAALRRMGYTGDEMTWHGFRSVASTLLNERGEDSDVIELQLAHKERNKVRAAYNRAERLSERRKMMQAWADYLEKLKAGKATAKRRAS